MAIGTETNALARLLRPLSSGLTTELASALVGLEADQATQARYDELAEKSDQGQLTTEERVELDSLVRANTLLGILKAEAEVLLAQRKTP
jgi:hypothetical protein